MKILKIVIENGAMILSKMPQKVTQKKLNPHYTKLCNHFGFKQKDIIILEYVAWDYNEYEHQFYKDLSDEMENAFEDAITNKDRLKNFYLCIYSEENGFQIIRESSNYKYKNGKRYD